MEAPTVNVLERRWFATQSMTRDLQVECDSLLEAMNQAQAAWHRARLQLAEFEALSDALEDEMAALDLPEFMPAFGENTAVMSAA